MKGRENGRDRDQRDRQREGETDRQKSVSVRKEERREWAELVS